LKIRHVSALKVLALVATTAAVSVGVTRWLESWPLSEPKWQGGRVEYLAGLDVTVTVWSTPRPTQALLIVQRGRHGSVGSMRDEMSRVNDAELAVLVRCDIDARGSTTRVEDGAIVVEYSTSRLVVDKGLRQARCEAR